MTRVIRFLAVVLFASTVIAQAAFSQVAQNDSWADWKFFLGEWTAGEAGGAPGRASSGSFSLAPDLGGQILLRKSHSEYPAANGRPATIHDDLMIIYPEAGTTKAVYFDNEGHVIHYDVSFSPDKNKVVFLSEKAAGAPHFRLTYEGLQPGTLKIVFEIAPPNNPDQFAKYVEGIVHRKP